MRCLILIALLLSGSASLLGQAGPGHRVHRPAVDSEKVEIGSWSEGVGRRLLAACD